MQLFQKGQMCFIPYTWPIRNMSGELKPRQIIQGFLKIIRIVVQAPNRLVNWKSSFVHH